MAKRAKPHYRLSVAYTCNGMVQWWQVHWLGSNGRIYSTPFAHSAADTLKATAQVPALKQRNPVSRQQWLRNEGEHKCWARRAIG